MPCVVLRREAHQESVGWLGEELELTAGGWIAFAVVAFVGGGLGVDATPALAGRDAGGPSKARL